ncbi:hydrogenase expression/formation protein [Thiohalocapsa marina]|uniref:Hydrogenase expression/formation protein n=1 Tax=Thiohalocapsa marina TaxID=424902 RepID=A0A5M8FVD1_9GAMM|nr:hydrogenase expression/formation C-terminal domain-containing protein [Thiohalocapsa marina]KAA6187791.1 hydrogenase expression/formation protein [Thiohalocapsa marina]
MSGLDNIPIQVEPAPALARDFGNALPILGEIRHAVARLRHDGEPSCIDLGAMPFGPGDEARLMTLLGRGEVSATVTALGPTHVWETGYPGVWVVEYQNTEAQRVGLQIEIDEVPKILRTQPADLDDTLAALEARLREAAGRHPDGASDSQ